MNINTAELARLKALADASWLSSYDLNPNFEQISAAKAGLRALVAEVERLEHVAVDLDAVARKAFAENTRQAAVIAAWREVQRRRAWLDRMRQIDFANGHPTSGDTRLAETTLVAAEATLRALGETL